MSQGPFFWFGEIWLCQPGSPDQAIEGLWQRKFPESPANLGSRFLWADSNSDRTKNSDQWCQDFRYRLRRKLQEAYPKATFYAFDLSKESVQLAAKSDASWMVNWFVGDLAHLPIQSKSMEVILDIFSPANYAEFERVLKDEGVIIKVVPTSSHLKEIRQLAQDQLTKQSYSNQEILEHFEDHCQILSSETVSLTKSLTPEERQALLAMTPLLFHVDQEKIDWNQLTEITIEAELLVGKIKIQRK